MRVDATVAGVELGGTKATAVLARGHTIMDRFTVPTSTPAATLAALSSKLPGWRSGRHFRLWESRLSDLSDSRSTPPIMA